MSLLLLVLVSVLFSTDASLFVSPFGNDANSGTQTSPFRHISYALSKALSLEKIYLLPGLYGFDNAFTVSKNASILAFSTQVFCSCQGDLSAPYVTVANVQGVSLTLQNITFVSCSTAVTFNDGARVSVNLMNVQFSQNIVGVLIHYYGCGPGSSFSCVGGVFGNNGIGIQIDQLCLRLSLEIFSSTFTGNKFGLKADQSSRSQASMWSISDSVFTSNENALTFSGDSVSISNTQFINNGNISLAPGAAIVTSQTAINLLNVTMSGNRGNQGAGLYLDRNSGLSAVKSVFTFNTAVWGGAIYAADNVMINLDSCQADNNIADTGGAFYCQPSQNSFLFCQDCALLDNVSKDGSPVNNCPTSPQELS